MKASLTRTCGPSRRFIRVLLAAAILSLPLASCDMLFTGMFSADIAQMTSRINLSANIPADHSASFNLSVLKLGSTEYVILFSADASNPGQTHLFVRSPALKILKRYSWTELRDTVLPVGDFKGNAAVAHRYDSTIVVGNVVMAPNPSGLVPTGKLPSPAQLNNEAVVGPGPGYQLWTSFAVD